MSLVLEAGRPVPNPWVAVPDGSPLPESGPVIVALDRWRTEREALLARRTPLGVCLKSSERAADLAEALSHLALVAVEFPKFRDGRGFTTARELRERYGFQGEIRAVGHILPDQYQFLTRVGVNTVQPNGTVTPSVWARALAEVTVAYQPCPAPAGALEATPASLLRRFLKPRDAAEAQS